MPRLLSRDGRSWKSEIDASALFRGRGSAEIEACFT
jgi:hypothetical protein